VRFRAKVIPSGNATGVEIPAEVMQALGPQARPPVAITINGHTWRSRVAAMRGLRLIGISAAHRAATGIAEGDIIEVDVELDKAPRDVVEPADLTDALNVCPEARTSFDRLPFGLRQKHVNAIEEAKSPDVRERRIRSLVTTLAT
jgi:bifunctional DNA-binding transcriptional regulator/antitoxin component of YhaV-PrlF toxin-antitoxin module